MKCCLCKKEIIDKYGNNAQPLKKGQCCDICNIDKVIPARLKAFKERNERSLIKFLVDGAVYDTIEEAKQAIRDKEHKDETQI